MSWWDKLHIKKSENFHILLWLLKDLCWCADFQLAGVIMILPTIGLSWYIIWISRESYHDFLPNLAVGCWIVANGIWMIGEFFYNDTTRPYALIFFVLGLLVISLYYVKELKNKLS